MLAFLHKGGMPEAISFRRGLGRDACVGGRMESGEGGEGRSGMSGGKEAGGIVANWNMVNGTAKKADGVQPHQNFPSTHEVKPSACSSFQMASMTHSPFSNVTHV